MKLIILMNNKIQKLLAIKIMNSKLLEYCKKVTKTTLKLDNYSDYK